MLTPRQKEIKRQLKWHRTLFNAIRPVSEDNRMFFTCPVSRREKRLLREFHAINDAKKGVSRYAGAKL